VCVCVVFPHIYKQIRRKEGRKEERKEVKGVKGVK
jgi:hypothetical protein